MSFKYTLDQISMKRVTANDPYLARRIPLIGFQQGQAHNTKLPYKPHELPLIQKNFQTVVADNFVEIWRLQQPVPAGGAIFMTNLTKDGETGRQIDDVVVRSGLHHHGLGTAMMQFAAAYTQQTGGRFIAWECEEKNDAQKMYRALGAEPRTGFTPYRLTKDMIDSAIAAEPHAQPSPAVAMTISPRFSLFRTMNKGIDGYDIDPTQSAFGLQAENLFIGNNVRKARETLIHFLANAQTSPNFIDVVVNDKNKSHVRLVESLGAEPNTYSGEENGDENRAVLWHLTGKAFEQAAKIGRAIRLT